jgi:hypothetical protein
VELISGEEIQLSDSVQIESVERVERAEGGPIATVHFTGGRMGKVRTAHLVTHAPTVGVLWDLGFWDNHSLIPTQFQILVFFYEHYINLFP